MSEKEIEKNAGKKTTFQLNHALKYCRLTRICVMKGLQSRYVIAISANTIRIVVAVFILIAILIVLLTHCFTCPAHLLHMWLILCCVVYVCIKL